MEKYWYSSFAAIADGGIGTCVSVSPGTARLTSSGTNLAEHIFTSCWVRVMRSASPIAA